MTDRELRIKFWQEDNDLTEEQIIYFVDTNPATMGECIFILQTRWREFVNELVNEFMLAVTSGKWNRAPGESFLSAYWRVFRR